MKSSNWKWILVFLAVFVVTFVIASFVLFTIGLNGGMMSRGYLSERGTDLFRQPWTMRGPMMGGFGRMGWFGGMLRMLFGLGLLALALVGVVALLNRGKHSTLPGNRTATVGPNAPAGTAVPGTAEPVVGPVAAQCANCGKELQPGWVVCPHCGTRVDQV